MFSPRGTSAAPKTVAGKLWQKVSTPSKADDSHSQHVGEAKSIPSEGGGRRPLLQRLGSRVMIRSGSRSLAEELPRRNMFDLNYDVGATIVSNGDFTICSCRRKSIEDVDMIVKISDLESSSQEVTIMRALGQHNHIVGLLDIFADGSNIMIVMEKFSGLFRDFVETIGMAGMDARIRPIAYQCSKGLEHIHGNEIVHRCICIDSLRLGGPSGKLLKIANFTSSEQVPGGRKLQEKIGPSAHMSPEMVLGQGYGRLTDIWSLGVVLFWLVNEKYPYKGKHSGDKAMEDAIAKSTAGVSFIRQGPRGVVPLEIIQFIKALLERNPSTRLSASEALEHRFLAGYTLDISAMSRPAQEPPEETAKALVEEPVEAPVVATVEAPTVMPVEAPITASVKSLGEGKLQEAPKVELLPLMVENGVSLYDL